MAAIAICSDFGAQKNSLTLFPLFPHLFAMRDKITLIDLGNFLI